MTFLSFSSLLFNQYLYYTCFLVLAITYLYLDLFHTFSLFTRIYILIWTQTKNYIIKAERARERKRYRERERESKYKLNGMSESITFDDSLSLCHWMLCCKLMVWLPATVNKRTLLYLNYFALHFVLSIISYYFWTAYPSVKSYHSIKTLSSLKFTI